MASLFTNIKKAFSGRGNSVLGIDIGSSSVKIIQLKNEKGVAVLENYGSLAVGTYVNLDAGKSAAPDANTIVSLLNALIKESKVTSNIGCIAVSSRSSFVRLMTLPNLPDNKLAEIVPYEARKMIPVPIDEVTFDFAIVPDALLQVESPDQFYKSVDTKPIEPKRKVMLTAIHNHELESYKKIAEALKLQVKFFELEVFSTLRSTVRQNRYPVLIADIGASHTNFYIIEKGIVLRSYYKLHGGQSMTEALASALNMSFEEAEILKIHEGLSVDDLQGKGALLSVIREIFAEVDNAISDFQHNHSKDVSKVVFTGGGSRLKGILEEASSALHTEVELADPFSNVQHSVFLREILEKIGPEFAVAIGCAMRGLEE